MNHLASPQSQRKNRRSSRRISVRNEIRIKQKNAARAALELEIKQDAEEVTLMLGGLLDHSKGEDARRQREKENYLYSAMLVNPLLRSTDEFTR